MTTKLTSSFKKNQFELAAWHENKLVCGIDEVGRGCLAGPVVTAAVMLKKRVNPCIKDSKILTPIQRIAAFEWIMKNSWVGIGITHHRIIDELNIYQATLHAMKRALMQLLTQAPERPSLVLVDAMPLSLQASPYQDIDLLHFNFGESKSSSIAAASIIAKVTRDRMMDRVQKSLAHYSFQNHRGYATVLHKSELSRHGASVIHRLSFIHPQNQEEVRLSAEFEQKSLFEAIL